MKKKTYKLTATVWLYPGESANWHFLTLPKAAGQEIKENHKERRRGFGSLPVTVTVGRTTWQTSIFPDKSSGSYVLPLKASVRQAEDVAEKDVLRFTLQLR